LAKLPIDELQHTLGFLISLSGQKLTEKENRHRQYLVYCLMISDCMSSGWSYGDAIAHAIEASKPEHYQSYMKQHRTQH